MRDARRMGWRRPTAAAAVLLLAGLLGACATIGRAVFKEPVVEVRNVRVDGLGITGGSLDLELAVYKPNNFDLEATRFTYNLLMDSTRVATGAIDTRQTFRSGDSSIVRIPIDFAYAGLGRAGQELMRSGSVNYRVAGDVTVATPLGNFTRPYDRTGRFTPLRGTTSR